MGSEISEGSGRLGGTVEAAEPLTGIPNAKTQSGRDAG